MNRNTWVDFLVFCIAHGILRQTKIENKPYKNLEYLYFQFLPYTLFVPVHIPFSIASCLSKQCL